MKLHRTPNPFEMIHRSSQATPRPNTLIYNYSETNQPCSRKHGKKLLQKTAENKGKQGMVVFSEWRLCVPTFVPSLYQPKMFGFGGQPDRRRPMALRMLVSGTDQSGFYVCGASNAPPESTSFVL